MLQTETFVVFIDAALQRKNGALQEKQYFFGSSLFAAQHYSSAYAVTSMTHPSPSAGGGGEGVAGTRDKIKFSVFGHRHFMGIHCIQISVTISYLNL